MRGGRSVVDLEGGIVVPSSLVEHVGFQRKVAEVDERGNALRIAFERCRKVARRAGAVSASQLADAALGHRERRPVPTLDCLGKEFDGGSQPAALHFDDTAVERRGARGPAHRQVRRAARPAVRTSRIRMQIDIITLFPDFFRPIVGGSILGRSQSKGLVQFHLHDLWKYVPPGERADDAPYGGGPGMVMRLGPIVDCLSELLGDALRVPPKQKVVVPSPAGRRFDHAAAVELTGLERLIIVCGHYEGIDNRLFDLVDAEEISLGDFVLTGGEIPALAFVDACVRLLPGAIDPASAEWESFSNGTLDWPHFTRPAVYRGIAVPEILLSGDHARVDQWRNDQARTRTARRRPDLPGQSDKGAKP